MATGTTNPEIISPENKNQARRIVQELRSEKLLSLDSEGVQLGKDGPLTLLQIGTLDGRVYLFDVMLNEREQDKSFFKDTGLESILTSNEIVKVIHSCSGDSAALFHQFGVHLQNVFDTQVAHLVIEEDKGRQLPTRQKLAEMCVQYSENAEVYEGKDDMKMKWCKHVGNFWAIRPLTDEMIDYASCDVTALIPEVYETQKKYIDENGLCVKYLNRVQEEIDYHIDPEQKEQRKTRNRDIYIAILTNIDERDPTSEDFHSLSADEKKAIDNTRKADLNKFSDKVKRLKQESVVWYMDDIEQELQTPENFVPNAGVWYKLGEIERSGGKASNKKVRSLKQQLTEVVLDDIETKYTPGTTLECLNSLECQVLKNIRPIGDNEQTFSETILSLHWKLLEKDMDEESEKITNESENEISFALGKLNVFISSDEVPLSIQNKAKILADFVQQQIIEGIEQELQTPESFNPHASVWYKLGEVERFGKKASKKKASRLKQRLSELVLDDIETNYTPDTTLECLNSLECQVLKYIRPTGDNEQTFSETILSLYWRLVEKDIDDETEKSTKAPENEVGITLGKLNFYISNDEVPLSIQNKAKILADFVQQQIIESIEQELQTPESFNPHTSVWYKLGEVERFGKKASKKKASRLKQRVSELVLDDIETNYTPDTTLECLNSLECQVLKYIRPTGDNEQTFSETILSLYWRLVEKDIDDETEKSTKAPENEVGITLGKLNFYISNDEVPLSIQNKAKILADFVQQQIIEGIEQELQTPESFSPHTSVWYKLGEVERFGKKASKKKASRLKQRLSELVLDDIETNYTPDTTLECLNSLECQVLKYIRPSGYNEQAFSETILSLYWRLVEKDIDDETEKSTKAPEYEVGITLGKLKFLARSDEVPTHIRDKAIELKDIAVERVLQFIPQKYTKATGIEDLSGNARAVLETLQVGKTQYHSVVMALYWKFTFENLCNSHSDILSGKLHISNGFKRKLNFLKSSSSVPQYVKDKAKAILFSASSG